MILTRRIIPPPNSLLLNPTAMVRIMVQRWFLTCWVALILPMTAWGQVQLAPTQVRTLSPGQISRVQLTGPGFAGPVRAFSSPVFPVTVVKAEGQLAELELTLPSNVALGPVALWLAHGNGPYEPLPLLIDDLPVVLDNSSNHALANAQELTLPASVDGTSDATVSDYYRFTATAGQRIAFEIQTAELGSTLDAILQLWDESGKPIAAADDNSVGADTRFSHSFAEAGTFVLEVRDSRYSAGGAYHLRVGDFPIIDFPFPVAVQRGVKTMLHFAGQDGSQVAGQEVEVPTTNDQPVHWISARLPDSRASATLPLQVRSVPQFVEGAIPGPIAGAAGIHGRLSTAGERDSFELSGTKGQVIRVASRTRSVGCASLLQMQIMNAAGNKIAETAIADSDEWSMDVTFPEDGMYRLEVGDLLKRGGDSFGYWIEIIPAGSFAIALKADAKVREVHALEKQQGACAVDLTVQRFGFDGEIRLSIVCESTESEIAGLSIRNPVIPAGAAEHRAFITVEEAWTPESMAGLRILGTGTGDAPFTSFVTSRDLRRIKVPHVPFPVGWNDGLLFASGAAASEPFFGLEPTTPILFPRPFADQPIPFSLKRLKPEFTEAIQIFPQAVEKEWLLAVAVDKDTYTVTSSRPMSDGDAAPVEPATLTLVAFGEFQQRGRIEQLQFPVQWIDPVRVSLDEVTSLVAGQTVDYPVRIDRQGTDPQPITLRWSNLPQGMTGIESVVVPPDQTQATMSLTLPNEMLAANVLLEGGVLIQVAATSTYGGREFSVTSEPQRISWTESPLRTEVFPTSIALVGPRDQSQLVVTGYDSTDVPQDWTRRARIVSSNDSVAKVVNGVVQPTGNGSAEVLVSVGGLQQSIPVVVTSFEVPQRIEFENHLLVALSKQNCNSGACHGSPSGKGGFRLSLRAFDPKLDTLTLIREEFGRRINTLEPEKSLLLEKPLMSVAHGGGTQLRKEDAAYEIMRDWIASGALGDPPGAPRVVRLEVHPFGTRTMRLKDKGQQLAVVAHLADGTQRDVTRLAAYETSNTAVATIDASGYVTPHQRGEAAILVRFLEHIESIPLMFIDDVPGFAWRSPEPNNYVDTLVNDKLRQLQYVPSDTCTDAEFIRRVTLDVVGLLPTVEETRQFLADTSADKRARLIDELLERPEYAKFWALKWGDLLQMTSKMVGDAGVYKYHRWVEAAIRDNMPYDQFAHELLTASGSTLSNPPANFYRTSTDMNACVETISQVFLGARLQCAKCHNHPFERWTQDNYYGLGAFFQRVQRRQTQRPGEMFVYSAEAGEVTQPRTGQVMKPWLPKQGEIDGAGSGDRRSAFAEWLVQPTNPYLSRIEVNRIWSQLFARGIVDPIDDFRDSNPPTNVALLEALAEDFVTHGFDRKHILRVMLNSRTYQASYQPNEFNQQDLLYCSHQEPRLLSAEQLLDAVNQATGLSQTFGHFPAGTRATQLPAPDIVKVDFLKVFGQPERSTVCACERADDSSLGMAIELFNGPVIHEKLRDANNRFRNAIAAGKSPEETIREMYVAAVCREPAAEELNAALEHCKTREDVVAGLEDVCWALLNTDEFLFQH